jgi:hypothetical protein
LVEIVRVLLARAADPKITVPVADRQESPLDIAAYYCGTPELAIIVQHALGITDEHGQPSQHS